jgi:hypothetical protein
LRACAPRSRGAAVALLLGLPFAPLLGLPGGGGGYTHWGGGHGLLLVLVRAVGEIVSQLAEGNQAVRHQVRDDGQEIGLGRRIDEAHDGVGGAVELLPELALEELEISPTHRAP